MPQKQRNEENVNDEDEEGMKKRGNECPFFAG
jgi:hypothetical protein